MTLKGKSTVVTTLVPSQHDYHDDGDDDDELGSNVYRVFPCAACGVISKTVGDAKRHREEHVASGMDPNREAHVSGFAMLKQAIGGRFQSWRYTFKGARVLFPQQAYSQCMAPLHNFLLDKITEFGGFAKAQMVMNFQMMKITEGVIIQDLMPFSFGTHMTTLTSENLVSTIQQWINKVDVQVEQLLHQGSGWTCHDVEFVDVNICRAPALAGSCTLHSITYKNGWAEFNSGDFSVSSGFMENNDRVQRVDDLTLIERNDPRLFSCFYLALARAMTDERAEDEPTLLYRYILDSQIPYPSDNVQREVGQRWPEKGISVKVSDIQKIEDGWNKDRSDQGLEPVAIHVIYQNESKSLFPLRVSPVYQEQCQRVLRDRGGSGGGGAEGDEILSLPKVIVLFLSYLDDRQVSASESTSTTTVPATDSVRGHYTYVQDPTYLLARRKRSTTDGDDTTLTTRNDVLICLNCFTTMYRREAYIRHVAWCYSLSGQVYRFPDAGESTHFNSKYQRGYLAPYSIYFDFETFPRTLKPGDGCSCPPEAVEESVRPKTEYEKMTEAVSLHDGVIRAKDVPKRCHHKLKAINEQEPFSFSALIVTKEGKVIDTFTYAGERAAIVFLEKLFAWQDDLLTLMAPENAVPMKITDAERARQVLTVQHDSEGECHICGEWIDPDQKWVFDHDHFSGQFLGPAHDECNLLRRERATIPVLAHNFS